MLALIIFKKKKHKTSKRSFFHFTVITCQYIPRDFIIHAEPVNFLAGFHFRDQHLLVQLHLHNLRVKSRVLVPTSHIYRQQQNVDLRRIKKWKIQFFILYIFSFLTKRRYVPALYRHLTV